MKRITSLDGVRAIAILLVVWGHWAEVSYHSAVAGAYASLGRRIFSVLSGYLITTLLMKEYEKSSTIQLRRFYVRRAYRILPAAMAFMVPVFVIYWHELRWYHMAAAALYVVNFDFGHPWFLGHCGQSACRSSFTSCGRACCESGIDCECRFWWAWLRSLPFLSRGMPLSAAPWKGR